MKMHKQILGMIVIGLGMMATAAWAADVEVIEPYVRAVPPGAPATAAFMQLKDNGDDIALVKAHSDVAESVELHTHTHDNGVMRMRPIKQLDLKKGETVALQPGGHHIMLIGLTRALKEGDTVNIDLEFSDGSHEKVSAPVRKIGVNQMGGGHMMGH